MCNLFVEVASCVNNGVKTRNHAYDGVSKKPVMRQSRKHVLVGVIASVFTTPFIGGGLTGYLLNRGIRGGMKAGVIVGGISSGLASGLFTIIYYYSRIQPAQQMIQTAQQMEGGIGSDVLAAVWRELFIVLGVLLVGGLILGLLGGGIGGYLATVHEEREKPDVPA